MAKPAGEAFLFYFERWRGSRPVQRMTFTERGIFLEMLIEQWLRGDLPDDPQQVSDAIASSNLQVGEIEAAWPAVRRQFVAVERTPGRIQNASLERVRRERRAWLRKQVLSGAKGGNAAARNRKKDKGESLQQPSSDPIPKNRTELEGTELERTGERSARTRPAVALDGSLPREHLNHVFCDQGFSVCVPAQVHAKLIGPLSRKFDGDRQKAHDDLTAWYPTVAQALPPEFVMGDAFKFWQGQFDLAFASKPNGNSTAPRFGSLEADVEKVKALVNR